MTMCRLALVLALALALAEGNAFAKSGVLDRSQTGDGVTVSGTSPFTDLPPSGALPYRITIRNDTGNAGTWHLSARTSANFSESTGIVFKQALTVPANTTSSFDLIIPVPVAADSGSSVLNLTVNGPGFGSGGAREFVAYAYSTHARKSSPFTAIGSQVLGAAGESQLETIFKSSRREFYGSSVDIAKLPVDWRGYAGVAVLLLQDSEWLALTAAQRDAVCDYVAQGGHLTVYTQQDPTARAPELHLPTPDGKPGGYGFGLIALEQIAAFPVPASTLADAISHNSAEGAGDVDGKFSRWGMRAAMGTITVSSVFVIGFVLLFGTLVGPVNLFVLARGRNRFRLFWTTPLISLVASFALAIGILVTDGLGGRGRQFVVTYSLPGMTREAVVQEQIARTAVLFSTHWHTDQDYLITPVSDHVLRASGVSHGLSMILQSVGESYEQEAGNYSGNWFRSRNVSAQYLQAVRPSRAVLTVLNASALAASSAAPVVLSSFPEELDRVFLVDSSMHYWVCDHLQPGGKQTCVPASVSQFSLFWDAAGSKAGGKLQPFLARVRDRAGCFYATGVTPVSDRLHTLDEIHWQLAQGIYVGPWVAAPEANP